MSEMMMAVRNYAPHDYRLEKIEKPRAGKEEVVVKI